jgi:hypothetical protein
MPEYLVHWQFWFAVIIVALVVNWAWAKFYPGKGKLV